MEQPLTQTEIHYYDRQLKLTGFGREAQLRLKNSRVLVVGAGGLGCPILQYLVTAGVGQIGVIDADTISFHNLHRQVLFLPEDVGKNKAETAVQRLSAQQPFVQLTPYPETLSTVNALTVIKTYDLVIDGTDNFATRYLVNDACVIAGVPFVSGAIDNYTGQISVFNYNGGPTYRCLYPEPPDTCGSCSIDGVLNVLPGIVGSLMANEALKVLSGYGEVLAGKLLVIDIGKNGFQLLRFAAVKENRHRQTLQQTYTLPQAPPATSGANPVPANVFLVDVRESWEYEESPEDTAVNIPLFELPERLDEWASIARPVLFLCPSGQRSQLAVKVAKQHGVTAYAGRLA